MSLEQNNLRMRRHKRRLNDDGSELAGAVRSYLDQHDQASFDRLHARQADQANGIDGSTAGGAPPASGGRGAGASDSTSSDDDEEDTISSPTPTRTTSSSRTTSTPTTTRVAATTSTRGGLGGLLDSIFDDESSTTTTRASTTSSSSTSTSTTSTSTSSRTTSSTSSSSTSSSSIMPITATMVVTSTPTPTLASATATPTSKSSSSSAGPIIGIVAGSLVGVVVLSGLVGFLFKKYNKKTDPYEANPFDRDDFQRHSTMIPDHFDSDDGHGGMSPSGPEMSEQHHYNNFGGPHYESGISAGMMGAGVGAATAGAGTAVALAHNEGGPRPPTMFARHAAHQQTQQAPQVGGYYKDGDYSHMASVSPQDQYAAPPSAAFANHSVGGYLEDPRGLHQQRSISPAPQLPPLAAFGGDPYSIAGVGRGQQGHNAAANNVANPYAHLDRAQPGQYVPGAPLHVAQQRDSGSVVSSDHHGDQRHASVAAAEALAAGLAHQSSLNRSASPYGNANYGNSQADFDTAGRPGTSEGRSGTPDIPNVQQTYAVGNNASSHGSVGSSDATSSTGSVNNQIINPFDPSPQHHHNPHQFHHTTQAHLQQQQEHDTSNHLSVRNLVPNHAVGSAGQRPISTASSFADPEDAYGGVY